MYIDIVPNRNSPPAILLRESYRVDGKVVKKTLANLSKLPPDVIDGIKKSLKGGKVVSPDDCSIKKSLPAGHVNAVKLAMERLNIKKLLSPLASEHRNVILAVIAQRLIRPASKMESAALFSDTTIASEFNAEEIDENDIYAAMDWLLDNQNAIEKRLASRHLKSDSTVFYDVSCSSYHGKRCSLAAYGYNRDGLKLPSIVYGLITDSQGRPIATQVYPGNTADPTTLGDQINTLRNDFSLNRFVLVTDRGLLTKTKIEELRKGTDCGWITCLRSSDVRALLETQDPSKYPLFTQENIAELVYPEFPDERFIACYNCFLAEERANKRQELLDATEKLLLKLKNQVERRKKSTITAAEIGIKAGRVINHYKMAKHFELNIADGAFSWTRREDSIAREARLDGIYILRTSEPEERISAGDVVRAYKRLGNVEKAFRTFKGVDLKIRPIYHQLEKRVKAHIFLCMLAYYVEWHMRQSLSSLLYAEDDLEGYRQSRDPVMSVRGSASKRRKSADKESLDGFELRRWDGLMSAMSTVVENHCVFEHASRPVSFTRVTEANAYQQRVMELLSQDSPLWLYD